MKLNIETAPYARLTKQTSLPTTKKGGSMETGVPENSSPGLIKLFAIEMFSMFSSVLLVTYFVVNVFRPRRALEQLEEIIEQYQDNDVRPWE